MTFESIFLENTGAGISIQNVAICSLVSFILGLLICYTHKKTSHCTKNFLLTLAVLPILVQVVIMMVNGNLGTSVAVLGAFSLVRFRSLPGNSKEIISIFWAMAIGLATGMGHVVFAICITIVISIGIILFDKFAFKEKVMHKKLKVTIPENLDYTSVFEEIFEKYTTSINLEKAKTTNMGSMYELSYLVDFKPNIKEKEFIDEIRCRNGNLTVILSSESMLESEL